MNEQPVSGLQQAPPALPAVHPPGVGIGLAVAPESYLLKRDRRDLQYTGLVDPVNARLTVRRPRFAAAGPFVADVLRAARAHDLGKVLVYAAGDQWPVLLSQGFVLEGVMDGFFGGEPAYIMGYLLTNARWACGDLEKEQAVIESALGLAPEPPPDLPAGYRAELCGPERAPALARVYDTVFTSFPSPMHDPAFLTRLIAGGAGVFRAVLEGDRIASVAAAEIDRAYGAAELTNCATLPAYRGQGLMQILLRDLEGDLAAQGIHTWFSLARALSFGMNRALRKCGYEFRGRLRGNSHIMGGYEDMNLWVKRGGAPTGH